MDRLEREILKPGELDGDRGSGRRARDRSVYGGGRAGGAGRPERPVATHRSAIMIMKAILDHIGIAVKDLDAALRFYRDALGLEIEAPEEVPSQQVRAHFVPVGPVEPRAARRDRRRSRRSRSSSRSAAPASITSRFGSTTFTPRWPSSKARGARLIDDEPRPGAEGALVAFIHPSSAQGVLIELKQSAVGSQIGNQPISNQPIQRYASAISS